MDHYSILDHSPASPTMDTERSGSGAVRAATQSVSAGIAAANAHLSRPSDPEPRFPGEDAGRSLAEMAHHDLDAALQLLADRAQYITGASGAAIALRRGEHNDMLCRASAGSNAPELGALLSMEYGLSGECVRTRQLLRCDDSERDPRVNRDVCRQLGIASVVVLPIRRGEQVLGIFELLSGKPRAFGERDLSALLRLSEMVETAVKHAAAAHASPAPPEPATAEIQPELDPIAVDAPTAESTTVPVNATAAAASPSPQVAPSKPEEPFAAPRKPLFWSAAMSAQSGGPPKPSPETIAVPPVLRNLQKCQACGFPVSQGRAFCVECEERQWRGQRLPHPAISAQKPPSHPPQTDVRQASPSSYTKGTFIQDSAIQDSASNRVSLSSQALKTASAIAEPEAAPLATPAVASASSPALTPLSTEPAAAEKPAPPQPASSSSDMFAAPPPADTSAPFLSSALQSESWFASNKYVLGALLVVAIVIAAIALLR
jgi:hypothetical protein